MSYRTPRPVMLICAATSLSFSTSRLLAVMVLRILASASDPAQVLLLVVTTLLGKIDVHLILVCSTVPEGVPIETNNPPPKCVR
jgi:hypothetical protein